MDDIISQIIKIDQQAQEKINDLKVAKEQHQQQFDADLRQANQELDRKAKKRIDSFAKVENEFIEAQRKEFEAELNVKLKKLNDTYEYSHDEIERNIFKSIIKPSV